MYVFLNYFSPIAETHSDFLILSAVSSDGGQVFILWQASPTWNLCPLAAGVCEAAVPPCHSQDPGDFVWCFWSSQKKQNAPAAFLFGIKFDSSFAFWMMK